MENVIDYVILGGLLACLVLLITLIIRQNRLKSGIGKDAFDSFKNDINSGNSALRREISESVQGSVKQLGEILSENQKNASDFQSKHISGIDRSISDKQEMMSKNIQSAIRQIELSVTAAQKAAADSQNKRLDDMDKSISAKQTMMNDNVQNQMKQLELRFKTLETTNEQKLGEMRTTIEQRLSFIQQDNNKKLDEIRTTVDEKLQKTLEDKMTNSFKLVSERLEQVYKGLGEMQTIASGVGDLKKVLSNVKTRGILGEIQLGAILSEILTPDQYDTEVATFPESSDHVEFAVKLPAGENGSFIYLPIDSKFPGDTFAALQDAYENGRPEDIKSAYKTLEAVIKKCAKDIHDKYIKPPYTTNFAIMFLPFEGLYAEVVNHGLVEILQRDYSVNIAGPSTMAAMLNSLQMGFRTLQIQKRSNEVWEILSAVKTEFDTFEKAFAQAKKRIKMLDDDMDKLIGTRTRAIQRKLREVQTLDSEKSGEILGIEENLQEITSDNIE